MRMYPPSFASRRWRRRESRWWLSTKSRKTLGKVSCFMMFFVFGNHFAWILDGFWFWMDFGWLDDFVVIHDSTDRFQRFLPGPRGFGTGRSTSPSLSCGKRLTTKNGWEMMISPKMSVVIMENMMIQQIQRVLQYFRQSHILILPSQDLKKLCSIPITAQFSIILYLINEDNTHKFAFITVFTTLPFSFHHQLFKPWGIHQFGYTVIPWFCGYPHRLFTFVGKMFSYLPRSQPKFTCDNINCDIMWYPNHFLRISWISQDIPLVMISNWFCFAQKNSDSSQAYVAIASAGTFCAKKLCGGHLCVVWVPRDDVMTWWRGEVSAVSLLEPPGLLEKKQYNLTFWFMI